MPEELVDHGADHVRGHGEADADIAAARRDDGGVDADQLALGVDQRAAGVAGVDGRVGLDEVLVAAARDPAAAERADDARGDGLAEAERVADGEHEVADLELRRSRRRAARSRFRARMRRRARSVPGSPPTSSACELAPVLQRDGDALGVLGHVVVGDDEALARVDDDARARGQRLARRAARPAGRRSGGRRDRGRAGSRRAGTRLATEMLTTAGVARSSSGAMVITPRPGSSAGYWAQAVPGWSSVATRASTASSRTAVAARSRAPAMRSHPSGTGHQQMCTTRAGGAARHRPGATASGGRLDLDPLRLPAAVRPASAR